jgi:hypothetical protein
MKSSRKFEQPGLGQQAVGMRHGLRCAGAGLSLVLSAGLVQAQSQPAWQFGGVLDVAQSSHALSQGGRDQGLQLGHSDLTASGPLGANLKAQVTASAATHEGRLESGFEEAWLETTRMPGGLQMRVGRFASQIGYLNQQHLHADDFVERPLLYRTMLGQHWNDDGLRLNWTAPTPFYLMLGVEAMRGKGLVNAIEGSSPRVGATTLVLKTGADLNRSHSWQAGLSQVRNRRQALLELEHEEGHEEHAHEQAHAHGAALSGRKISMVDLTWKWAPQGNAKQQQLRLGMEAARITQIHPSEGGQHSARAVSAVWRWTSQWEVGARMDWLRARLVHEGAFESGKLAERALMLAYKPSHMQTVRLQYSTQGQAQGFDNPTRRALQLQYVLGFGAHPAHAF